ncbi:hypothetical protein BZG35_07540 [Brevundimonas sp. LM2]|uniref:SMI1/KNR4 family protein n=1 Tax=Brevundimonas sp. LM2 TaxID=1938605 RepID=UPI000983C578|nr:SMI1/KNR4 family protein [Brevundimonas sp. LM2]AQR61521.1 hypothetical protein BZG35_07540 [Brevundimonas sp. LM2]
MAFPATEATIAEAERSIGRSLPPDLRARLARSNGGDITIADDSWSLIPVRDVTDRKRLSRTANDIVRETEQARAWRNFPKEGFAVASNGTGDLLILIPGSLDVHHWCHETGAVAAVTVDWI